MKVMIIGFAVLMIVVSLLLGWWAQHKAKGAQAFFGGTALFGPVTVALSSMAAVASAFAVVGVPGVIYASGSTMLLWMLGSGAFAMSYIILGKKMRAMAELGPVATLGDVSDLRFGKNRRLKLITSLTIFIGSIAYLASQIKGVSEMFAHLMGWSPAVIGIIVFGSLIIYMVVSGEVGGLLTQAFQGLIMVIAAVIMIIAFFWVTGGMSEMTMAVTSAGKVTADGITKSMPPNIIDAWGLLPGPVVVTYILIPFLGVLGQPQILTRMYSLKDPADMAKLGLWSAGSHGAVAFFATLMGFGGLFLVARGLVPPLSSPDRTIFVFADYVGPYAQFFVYTATLAAAMSSASMFLSLCGSLIARDMSNALGYNFSPEKQINISRVVMAIIGILSVYMGLNSTNLVAILGTFGYGTFMAATFPVFIIGLLWERCSSQGALAGAYTAFGLSVLCLILNQFGFKWPNGLPWYTFAVGASIAATVFVSLFTNGCAGPNLDKKVRCVIDL